MSALPTIEVLFDSESSVVDTMKKAFAPASAAWFIASFVALFAPNLAVAKIVFITWHFDASAAELSNRTLLPAFVRSVEQAVTSDIAMAHNSSNFVIDETSSAG